MERWVGRVAVVTGASNGIGAAIAYQLQDAGVHVVALARRQDKISSAVECSRKEATNRGRSSMGKCDTPGKLYPMKCDVSNEEDVLTVFKWVDENLGAVHILVNNAGVAGKTLLTETDTEQWKRILDTNILGLCMCTREALKLMKVKGIDDGHIVHIGSVSGHTIVPIPELAIYSGSKHAVRTLTEFLRIELLETKSKIKVTEVSPGIVRTNLFSEDTMHAQTKKKFGIKDASDIFKVVPHLEAEDVSDAVLYTIATPPHVQIQEIIIHPLPQ